MSTSPMPRRTGFTLVEMLVTLVMLSIVMASVTGMITATQRDYTRQRQALQLEENVRSAELTIARLLRTATVDPFSTSVGVLNVDPLARGVFDNIRVRSDYNPADGDVLDLLEDALVYTARDTLYVRWQAGAVPQPVAYPVRSLLFEYFAVDNTPVTTQAMIGTAVKAKFTVRVPTVPGGSTLKERVTWVHFRN
jgi:prepilin-type N-terminal cleavage/methylation domain-containing protein